MILFLCNVVTMKYTEQQLIENYNTFIKIISSSFTGERHRKLLFLYNEDNFGYRLTYCPASSKEHYHSSYPGGYIDHVNNVYKSAIGLKKVWEFMGGVIDFTDEELAFVSLNHDLGKLGDLQHGEYYIEQDNEWALKNKGEIYKINPDLQYMSVADRTLYTLQQFEISCTWKEYLAIKLIRGMFEDANKPYLANNNKDFDLKTNLPRILSEAEYIACRVESDKFKVETD